MFFTSKHKICKATANDAEITYYIYIHIILWYYDGISNIAL